MLIAAGLTTFAPSSWGVDGGYGPGSSGGTGTSGTFGNIVMAKTIGEDGGSIFGHYRHTDIRIVVPPDAFSNDKVVEVVSSVPDCDTLKGRGVIVGLAVYATNGKDRQDDFTGAMEATVSSPRITSDTQIIAADDARCTPLHLAIDEGQVTVPLDTTSAFVISSPPQTGQDHHRFNGRHDWFGHEHDWWLLDEFVPSG